MTPYKIKANKAVRGLPQWTNNIRLLRLRRNLPEKILIRFLVWVFSLIKYSELSKVRTNLLLWGVNNILQYRDLSITDLDSFVLLLLHLEI